MPIVTLRYDLRAPHFGPPAAELYAAALDQCGYADAIDGFDTVMLSEHHASPDGYTPSPIVVAAGVAGRTHRISLVLAAAILPLYEPVRLAEDLAVLDLVSGGRLQVVLVAGYRRVEYEMFGKDMGRRAKLMEEALAILDQAWSGEEFEHGGCTVRVTPRPLQRPRPPVLLGGNVVSTARRAAKLADGFVPGTHNPALEDAYWEEVARVGRPGRLFRQPGALCVHVAEDPDKAWSLMAPFAMHEMNSYGEWTAETPGASTFQPISDPDALREHGLYRVLTPDECVAYGNALADHELLVLHPLVGGLTPDEGWASLELFATKVLPQLRRVSGPLWGASGP